MPRKFEVQKGDPLLDIGSFARGGPHGGQLSPAMLEHIQRTVRRVPEVMVKVLPRGTNDFKAAGKHLDYIGRKGELELETDDGQRLKGRIGSSVLQDWDLDIDDSRPQGDLSSTGGRRPKLIHKLMFSMPPGTPPHKVISAVRNFAREEFALRHRYAFALHVDEPHPHVHLVLKALGEDGVRLNIKKGMLRAWRSQFARHLRTLGVAANATERAVRGQYSKAKKDGIYRADARGQSRHENGLRRALHSNRLQEGAEFDLGRRLVSTRFRVEDGWQAAAQLLQELGYVTLAEEVRDYVITLPPVRSDREKVVERVGAKDTAIVREG